MKLGWLQDIPGYIGGAELTAQAQREAAPAGVEIIDCKPGQIAECDAYVVHNCTQYAPDTIDHLRGKPVVKYVHDVWGNGSAALREHLIASARLLLCSPLHREKLQKDYGADGTLVPPPCRMEKVEAEQTGECVWLGHGMYPGKGIGAAVSWANTNEVRTDFIGDGPYMPATEGYVTKRPPVEYEDVPRTLARYESFLFTPTRIEPFGRATVEAWAQGLRLHVNESVGARWWIENQPDALFAAAETFWQEVERTCS